MVNRSFIISPSPLCMITANTNVNQAENSCSKQHGELATRMIDIHLMTALRAQRIMTRVCGIAFDRKQSTRAGDNKI